MDSREQRGMELAATRKIRHKGNVWSVPSATGDGTKYTVDLAAENCSCPDHNLHRVKCKHIYAAFFVKTREENSDGSITETTIMATTRTTYPQNWPAYNGAQVNEKDRFQVLLHDLCAGVPVAPPRVGRPSLPMPDAIFAATFKVYSTLSARRFMSDLREAHNRRLISRLPCYNTIFNVLENDNLTPILRSLVERSALPLKAIEVDFAADSSGFTTSRFSRWFDHKYGKQQKQHEWVKVHLMCGVKTNIVTAIEIGAPNAADTKLLSPMLATTARNFKVMEVSGDKGYSSKTNLEIIAAAGAMPFIAFQDSAMGHGGGMWSKMFGYFQYRREDILAHYHKRSNVESTFSMIKRKFGDGLRSRTDAAMKNETMCKILCHNLVVLIHEMHELGIDPVFWPRKTST
jgi:transposase